MLRKNIFPWTTYNLLNRSWAFQLNFKEYVLGLGPTFIFSLFGIKDNLRPKDYLSLLLFSWFVSPFIGIFLLSNTFNLGNVFFFHASHYVPVGVIGAIGFVNLVNFIAIKLKLRSQVILLPLLIILLLYFAVSWYGSIKKEISRWTPNIFNIFLARDFFSAFDYLNTNSQPESVVLAGEFLGTIIPAFTHNRTVAGHPVNTYDFTQKRLEVANFFTQNNSANAKEIIKKYNVAYTFFTYDTGVPQAAFINDLGLEMIYKNPIVTLFKTKYD
ncbi:hypothetical protein HY612_01905 [Candidatus Roizmanbacteria bacterium]|nr:hypothetical protein [Candidatus Roizmanbacteria bacterium]